MKKISKTEIHSLALLHYKSLPQSSPSLLGLNYVHSIYQYFSLSADEHIIYISHKQNKCSGLALYSANPGTLSWRLLANTSIILDFFKMCFSQSLGKTYRLLRIMLSSSSNEKPELLYLFVNPSDRGLGLGTKLVKDTISYSLIQNDDVLSVRCENHLVAFYTNLGFTISPKKKGQYNFLTYSQTQPTQL